MWWAFFSIPFPYFDEHHSHERPYVTIILLWVNFLVFITTFVLTLVMSNFSFAEIFNNLGVIPADIILGKNLYTLVTYLFVSTGILQFLGNMWFLYIFGDNVEHNMGRVKFSLFFLISGTISALAYVYLAPENSLAPLVGASGAISGILGAYMIFFPENKIHIVLGPRAVFKISAFWYIWIWFVFQGIFLLMYSTRSLFPFIFSEVSIPPVTHLVGFASGVILAYLFGKRTKYKNYKYETPEYLNSI